MSTTWYVSQQRGSNSYNGLAPVFTNGTTGPKATLLGSNSLAAVMTGVGDLARLGPGTYREKPVFQANNQAIYGDSLAQYLLNDTPGEVRITGAGTNEIPTSGAVIQSNGYTGCALNGSIVNGVIFPLRVDGCLTYSILGGTSSLLSCNYVGAVGGYAGFSLCIPTNCFGDGGINAFYRCTSLNCIGAGGYLTFQSGTSSINCLSFGGYEGFTEFAGSVHTVSNCIAMNAMYGFYGNGAGTSSQLILSKCYAEHCYNAYGGGYASYPLVVTGCTYSSCYSVGAMLTDTPTLVAANQHDFGALLRDFAPIISAGTYGLGAGANTDVVGLAQNPCSIGPYNAASGIKPPAWPMGMIQ
jgi:hypothetical protein